MKKNKMMRLASAMMVLTLMSTSVISGTFAKYVTSDSASDSARVAKFGVVVTADGSLFDKNYKDAPETEADKITVVSNDSTDVVAPGTKNDDGITFTITGQPEVDVELAIEVTNDTNDIFLAAKNGLPDMTTGSTIDTFDNDAKYEPIKYTLWQKKSGDTDFNAVAGAQKVNLSTLASKLEALSVAKYDANTDLAANVGTLKITWEWDFDATGAGTYDKQDTLLGDLAANTTLTPATSLTLGTDYNLTTGLTVTVTVTQID